MPVQHFEPSSSGQSRHLLHFLAVAATLGLTAGGAAGDTCTAGAEHLCLQGTRFRVSATWSVPGGAAGAARATPLTADTGTFWFFDPDNVELVVKVLDACPVNDHLWVFAAGLTNVEVELLVEDTWSGERRNYPRPAGPAFAPIQDTAAFARCDQTAPGDPPAAVDWSRDVLHTALRFDLATHAAQARITLAPSSSRAASFAVGDLAIHDVRHQQRSLRYAVAGDRLDIGVPDGGEPIEIVVDYSFRTQNDLDGYLATGSTYLWPYHCGNLYPCKPAPAEGSTFELEVVNPPPGEVVIVPREIATDAPSYMPAFAVGPYGYELLGHTAAGTEVGAWTLPEGGPAAREGAAGLVAVFDWLETTYGDYAFGDAVASVAVRWGPRSGGAIEHHPFWHVGEDAMDDAVTHTHEAAHGWFGNGVRLRCWEDFVLSEGTASYLAARAIEATAGAGAGAAVWERYRLTLEREVERRDTVAWPSSTCNQIDLLDHPLNSFVPYMKGAFFLRAVEDEVGRAAIDAALRRFYQAHRGRAAGMQDLLDLLAAETGFDPGPLAEAWLRQLGVPAS